MLTCELFPIRKNSGASSAISKVLLFVYRECSFPKAQRGVKNIMQFFLTALNLSSLPSYPKVSLPLLMTFPWQLPMLLWLCLQPSCCSLAPLLPLTWNQTETHCNQSFCFIKLHVKPLWPLLCSSCSLVLCCGLGQHSCDFSYLFTPIELMASLHLSYMSNSQQLYPPVFTSHWSKATKEQNKWRHWITDMYTSMKQKDITLWFAWTSLASWDRKWLYIYDLWRKRDATRRTSKAPKLTGVERHNPSHSTIAASSFFSSLTPPKGCLSEE